MANKLFAWFVALWKARIDDVAFERQVVVSLTDEQIVAAYPNGESQSISWSEVIRVAIETNDSGPWGADLWWLLEGRDKRCTYPGGATGDLDALRAFPDRFPGFNDKAVTKANGCTSNARFVCWEKQ
jgi:hypothetical protein